MSYSEIFNGIVDALVGFNFDNTNEVTRKIKKYFHATYETDTHKVLSSYKETNSKNKEFLLDVLVTNFKPLEVISSNGRKLKLVNTSPTVHLAVESELGGVSASGPLNVQRNAIEDFIKLTLINSEYKVMIYTSMRYKGEDEASYLKDRCDDFSNIYQSSTTNEHGLLLIHIKSSGESGRQVRVDLSEKENFTAYILNQDGEPSPVALRS